MRQRLIPRLADGCARMPAALKDILSCGDPVRARVIAPPQGIVVNVRAALHVRASVWLSLLRSTELEGMVWQRLIPRLADGCARMPAAHKDILSCGDPVCARVIAPPQGSCHRACSTRVRASVWLSLLRSAELEGMVWQRLIPRLADGCVLGCQRS